MFAGGNIVEPPAGTSWAPFENIIQYDAVAANYPWLTGSGQGVVMIDTGYDYTHPAFDGAPGPGKIISVTKNFIDGTDNVQDDAGHGTGIAGILGAQPYMVDGYYNHGLLPGATLIALKQKGSAQIKDALDWVIANRTTYNITTVNLTDFLASGFTHVDNAYDSEVATLKSAGVFINSPVGNGHATTPIGYPANNPNVFGSGGIDKTQNITPQTQIGASLDFLAPGGDVIMPYYFTPGSYHGNTEPIETYVDFALGTSWSSPHVVALATMIKQIWPDATPDQIATIIKSSGKPVVDPDDGNTYPIIQMFNATTLAYRDFDDVYQGNTTLQAAAPLAFGHGGVITVNNLRALVGKPDYYSFTVGTDTDVNLSFQYAGTSSFGGGQLLNSSGAPLANIPVASIGNGLETHLRAGTYYMLVNQRASLEGSYGLNITLGNAVAPPNAQVNSIAYEPSGMLDVAYFDITDHNLHFAQQDANGIWTSNIVIDSASGAGANLSLAIDHAGNPAIAYWSSADNSLKYAFKGTTGWAFLTADNAGSVGRSPSLAFDGRNHPVISYYDQSNQDLKVASLQRSGWTYAVVDSAGDVGQSNSLAINTAGTIGIAYEDTTNHAAKYAFLGRSWVATTVDPSVTIGGQDISLAFDKNGVPAFSYSDSVNQDLKYARFGRRGWGVSTVVSRSNVGNYNSLQFDSAGKAEILAFNSVRDNVFAAIGDLGSFVQTNLASGGGTFLDFTISGSKRTYSWFNDGTGELTFSTF